MKRKQEMTEDDLLMLPPIDGLVNEIKGQQVVSSREKPGLDLKGNDKRAGLEDVRAGDDSWQHFLRYGEYYQQQSRKEARKSYPIDVDIVNTLKRCGINKLSTCNIINSILRAFIEQNKNVLRQYFTEEKSLI